MAPMAPVVWGTENQLGVEERNYERNRLVVGIVTQKKRDRLFGHQSIQAFSFRYSFMSVTQWVVILEFYLFNSDY